MGTHGPEEIYKKTNNLSSLDDVWPDMWKHMSDAAKKKAKQKWTIEKPQQDNTRQLRGTHFMEPDDEEFKLTIESRSEKVGSSDTSKQCLAKYRQRAMGKPTAVLGNARQNMLVLLMPTKARDQG